MPLMAQQSRVNIQYDPQRTEPEGILPYNARVLSPEVHDDHTVTFRVNAPNAQSVQLTGSMFVGNNRQRPNFTKGANGIWELTIHRPCSHAFIQHAVRSRRRARMV